MAKPLEQEENLIDRVIQYAAANGYSESGISYKNTIINACTHVLSIGVDPYTEKTYGFENLEDAQFNSNRLRDWATETL